MLPIHGTAMQPQPPVSTSQLRRMLDGALPTDAQLDAFCLDYLPSVHRQFSGGMERTQKLNLLLASTPGDEVLAQLRLHLAAQEHSVGTESASARRAMVPMSPAGRPNAAVYRKGVIAIPIVLGIFGLVLLWHPAHEYMALHSSTRTGHDLTASAEDASVSADLRPWLTSEPPGALVYASPSGRFLGQTPWLPPLDSREDSNMKHSLAVCLRSPGFVPQFVKLEPGAAPSWPRPIHVRLQRETSAAPQRERQKESCHVQTPILE